MEIKVKRLTESAELPKKATDGSGAYDIKCTTTYFVQTGNPKLDEHTSKPISSYLECHTGLAIQIPKGYVGLAFPRSSISDTGHLMCNGVGVIDSDYRGELTARFYNLSQSRRREYESGDRIFQLMIIPVPELEFVETKELDKTERGEGGYGSTGR